MERTQIYLEESLKEGLRALAERERRSLAAVVRDAAAEYLARHAASEEKDPLLGLIGMGRGGPEDGSVDHDHYLYGAPKDQ